MTDDDIINECRKEIRRLRFVIRTIGDEEEKKQNELRRLLKGLQTELESSSDDGIADCKEDIKERVNACLELIGASDEDNS